MMLSCPHCRQNVSVAPNLAGRQCQCPHCQKLMRAPATPASVATTAPARPSAPGAESHAPGLGTTPGPSPGLVATGQEVAAAAPQNAVTGPLQPFALPNARTV